MQKFNSDRSIAALELEQLVAEYFHILDHVGGGSAISLFTEDCIVDIGAISYRGREAMKNYYEARQKRVDSEQNGVRTSRHAVTNFRVSFSDNQHATVNVLCVTFSGAGSPPLMNASVPTVVTDIRFECTKEADGFWRLSGYYGAPIFVGNDPFLIKAMLAQSASGTAPS